MPKFIVHHKGRFVEWSTVVDAPVSDSMTRDEMLVYLTRRYGEADAHEYPARLDRAERNGTSVHDGMSASDLFVANRAGPNETELTDEEIYREYFTPPATKPTA